MSANGYTARDLWFRLNSEIDVISDTFQACVLIGTNDVGTNTNLELFKGYYQQILLTLAIKGYKAVFCGTIPPIYPDGHIFFGKRTQENRKKYNAAIKEIVDHFHSGYLVEFENLSRELYEDPVHFNEKGNRAVAEAFSQEILQY